MPERATVERTTVEPLYVIMASNWPRGKKGPTLAQPRLAWPGCLPAN